LPKFSYVVKNKEGKTYRNIADAASKKSLIASLQRDNYFIVSIKQFSSMKGNKTSSSFSNKRRFTHKGIKLNDLLVFANQLATMLDSGVTLIRSLNVIQTQAESENMFNVLSIITKDVEHGKSLSESLAQHPKVFNQFWVSLVEVGEASGTIPTVLKKLAFYLEQQAAFRATIISGIIYPVILFAVALIAVAFFALFVGPRFEEIFDSMKVDLPLITTVLLDIFRFIKLNFFKIIGIILVAIFIVRKYIKTYTGKTQFEHIMFRMPVFGEIYRLIIVERFTSQLAILIDSGVPILYALDITERLVNNNTCAIIVSDVRESVKQGQQLVYPMEKSGFFPPMAVQMINVGEETGELSKMLKHVSKFYQNHIEVFMKRFSTAIEPFMLIFMGVMIGTIVIAMFMPLFNISKLG